MARFAIPASIISLFTVAFAQRTADEVLGAILDSQRSGQAMRGTITMTVVRPGQERAYQLEMISDGSQRSLMRVLAPSRDAGQAFLRDGDNLWLYNPRLRRTLRLHPSGQSDAFLGSDLSYSDLAGRDLEMDYTAEITSETPETIELTLIPQSTTPTPYSQVVLVADAETYARPGERTVMVISAYAFDVEVPAGCFSERALEQGC
jgi:outer membrane lipoprotein-sorting protein